MARPSASDVVARLLTIVPWIAERDGPTIDEVCERFGLEAKTLARELERIIPFVGRYPYTPDNLMTVEIDEDRIWIRYANFFEQPPRLTAYQGLAVLAAGLAALEAEGGDRDGPLARGLAKVAAVLHVDLDEDLRVILDPAARDLLPVVRTAVEQRQVLDIDYFSHARVATTTRTIEPVRLFHTQGAWYLAAWCRTSEAERVFRLDRITRVAHTDERHDRTATTIGDDFDFDPDADRVVLDLAPEGAWVAETYPVDDVERRDDGSVRVRLIVTAPAWLERLLLRLGPHGTVVDAPENLQGLGPAAAARILARYR